MDHDQLFKAVLTAQLAPFMELFFPAEAAQLDLDDVRFVDKELFAAPPMGPGREVDLLANVRLRSQEEAMDGAPASALVAIWIEIQAQREPGFVWRHLEYYALLRRLQGLPVFPIVLMPVADVLGREQGRRPRVGYERVAQRDTVLGHTVMQCAFLAITLHALDAENYLARPQALAGALAALMQPSARTPPSVHKLACLRRIMEGEGVMREETRKLLTDVVETYLRLRGTDEEQFEQLLQRSENEGIRQRMKTWSEEQQEIGEERGKEIGKKLKAQEDVLRVLEARFGPVTPAVVARVRQIDDVAALDALLIRVATATTLAETGLA